MAIPKTTENALVSEKSQLVQMRLQPKTLQIINSLSELTGTTNRTQLISSSIHLTEELVRYMQAGAKVYVESKDGTKELLKIIGI